MKSFLSTALLSFVLISAKGSAQTVFAQASVPFDFHVGDTLLHSGKYNITELNGFVRVGSSYGAGSVFRIATPSSRHASDKAGKLVFMRYNGEYYLSQIWKPRSSDGFTLPPSKREQELARNGVLTAKGPVTVASR
jgi:hypothetical protein